MEENSIPKSDVQKYLEILFGEDAVLGHYNFMRHCQYIHSRVPDADFNSIVYQIAKTRGYELIGNLIFVHQSNLNALQNFLAKDHHDDQILKPIAKIANKVKL